MSTQTKIVYIFCVVFIIVTIILSCILALKKCPTPTECPTPEECSTPKKCPEFLTLNALNNAENDKMVKYIEVSADTYFWISAPYIKKEEKPMHGVKIKNPGSISTMEQSGFELLTLDMETYTGYNQIEVEPYKDDNVDAVDAVKRVLLELSPLKVSNIASFGLAAGMLPDESISIKFLDEQQEVIDNFTWELSGGNTISFDRNGITRTLDYDFYRVSVIQKLLEK